MEWTSLNRLREMFFEFFQTKQHLKLGSFSLIPKKEETSLLIINSGMAPMKDWFLAKSTPPSRRVVTCQKCVRTVDLQNVGRTSRHGTFFEMLGNFSFGDYFKREAISFAWDFVIKILKMPIDRLYVTVFENDDESKLIWEKEQGLDPSHIFKLGKDDNFWEIGKGPCGPCTELYFDRGEQFGCKKETCGPGCDCDRFVEFWNLVFSQYCNDGNGNYEDLAQKNIDTGMGLERLACIVQGVNNLFEVDSIKKILLEAGRLAGVKYGQNEEVDVFLRIVTDHIRTSVFLISDGVLPSNEGRGYVLRRIIRRILTSSRAFKVGENFLSKLAEVVAEESSKAYPELIEKLDHVCQVLQFEQQSFGKILVNGQKLFHGLAEQLKASGRNEVDAQNAFKLCDTFGMPFDLLSDLAVQNGFEVDEAGFLELLNEQRERAKVDAASKNKAWKEKLNLSGVEFATDFVGYDELQCEGRLKLILVDGKQVECATASDRLVGLIFDKTPFYAQGGGQVGDSGFILNSTGNKVAEIVDCKRLEGTLFCHEARVLEGVLKLGDVFKLEVDSKHRAAVSRNHTAAHILQQALINVLGAHVHQAGQLVDSEKLRFDFSHSKALSAVEIAQIEAEVNELILSCVEVRTKLMALDEAKKAGAKALFDEKYSQEVRVVEIGSFSKELCGGTHVKNSGELGLFKIVSETSVGTGVRRIEALTGRNSLSFCEELVKNCKVVCSQFKVENVAVACEKIAELKTKLKVADAEIEELKFKASEKLFEAALIKNFFKDVGLNFAAFSSELLSGKLLKSFGEHLIKTDENLVLLICSQVEGKMVFLVGCAKKAVDLGLKAANLVKILAEIVQSKGGGRPEIAMAGVKTKADLDIVRMNFEKVVAKALKK